MESGDHSAKQNKEYGVVDTHWGAMTLRYWFGIWLNLTLNWDIYLRG
jgi:hypothetical protein